MYNDTFRPINISQLAMSINKKLRYCKNLLQHCKSFHLSSDAVDWAEFFLPCCSSIRDSSSPQNFLSYAVSIVQKVQSQPKLLRFDNLTFSG